MRNKFLLFVLLSVAFVSCSDSIVLDSPEKQIFVDSSVEGLYEDGLPIFTYNSENHQIAFNEKRKMFRLQTDEQDSVLNVIFVQYPLKLGAVVPIRIEYRTPVDVFSSESNFELSRHDKNYIWLWDRRHKTGLVVRYGKSL